MKLEREPVFGHKTLNQKLDPKSFDYEELSLDSDGLKKAVSGNLTEQMHEFKDRQKDADSLLYLASDGNEVAASKLDFGKEETANSQQDVQVNDKSEILSRERDPDCYIDKSTIECELPEFQICYKENGFSSVKDICIDEGMDRQDKIKFPNSVDCNRSLRSFVFPDHDTDKEINKDHSDGRFETGGLDLSTEDESSKELVCDSKNSVLGIDNGTAEKIANDISQDKIVSKELSSEEPRGEEESPFRSPSSSDAGQISSDKEAGDLDMITEESRTSSIVNELSYFSKVEKRRITFDFDSSASIINAKDHLQKSIPECSGTGTPPQEVCPTNDICGCDDTQNVIDDEIRNAPTESTETQHDAHDVCDQGSTIIDDEICDAPTALTETQNGNHNICDPQARIFDDEICDAPIASTEISTVSDEILATNNLAIQLRHVMAADDEFGIGNPHSVSGHFPCGVGESSFSAAGPVPYSGSISLRSDSSTTSTRSFAFPILQSDWHSSPVRMAKAERRHFRKHGGWRQGLLCCRF